MDEVVVDSIPFRPEAGAASDGVASTPNASNTVLSERVFNIDG
jgi:hypothetical protein